ncbi:MAG: hypothetical protein HY759_03610 [Nitrospirae bacterium]|nr:hypothetical protein [Nitrospirota bacterium]
MKYLRACNIILLAVIILILYSNFLAAYEPAEGETIIKISKQSDAFIFGIVKDMADSAGKKPTSLYKVEIKDIYFDRIGKIKLGDVIDVVSRVGFIFDHTGRKVKIKELNAPDLIIGSDYIIYLLWDESQNAFRPTSGESSVLIVDNDGKVLNIDGFYILDVQNDKLVVGPSKEQKEDFNNKGIPPSAVVEDITGNVTTISPQTEQKIKAHDIDPARLLNLQQFINKVGGGKDNVEKVN